MAKKISREIPGVDSVAKPKVRAPKKVELARRFTKAEIDSRYQAHLAKIKQGGK